MIAEVQMKPIPLEEQELCSYCCLKGQSIIAEKEYGTKVKCVHCGAEWIRRYK